MSKAKEVKSYKMDANTKNVVNFFEQISKVPRGSGNEAGIREFLVNWANENKFDNKVESAVIGAPGSTIVWYIKSSKSTRCFL